MITGPKLRTVLVLGSIFGILLSSFSYLASDVGAWSNFGGNPSSCRETAGSSADDEVVFVGLWILIFPALIRLGRFAKPIHWLERCVFFLFTILVVLFMSIATGCADFVFTAKYTGQPGLTAVPIFWSLAIVLYLLPNPSRDGRR
jgi:hypothetical protein